MCGCSAHYTHTASVLYTRASHFEPTGRYIDEDGNYYWKDGNIIPGTPEELDWFRHNPDGWEYEEEYEDDDEEWEDEDEDEL